MSNDNQDTPLVLVTEVAEQDWEAFKSLVQQENEVGLKAYVRFVQDASFFGASENELRAKFNSDETALILAADEMTFTHPEHPVLCIEPEAASPSFRTPVKELWIVENNVSIGNILFEEFFEDQVVGGWFVSMDE